MKAACARFGCEPTSSNQVPAARQAMRALPARSLFDCAPHCAWPPSQSSNRGRHLSGRGQIVTFAVNTGRSLQQGEYSEDDSTDTDVSTIGRRRLVDCVPYWQWHPTEQPIGRRFLLSGCSPFTLWSTLTDSAGPDGIAKQRGARGSNDAGAVSAFAGDTAGRRRLQQGEYSEDDATDTDISTLGRRSLHQQGEYGEDDATDTNISTLGRRRLHQGESTVGRYQPRAIDQAFGYKNDGRRLATPRCADGPPNGIN